MKQIHEIMFSIDQAITRVGLFGLEPHIVVSTTRRIEGVPEDRMKVDVPLEFVRNGHIVLKVTARAVDNFQIDYENAYITFNTAFAGRRRSVVLPIENIVAVTAGNLYDVRYAINYSKWEHLPVTYNPLVDLSAELQAAIDAEKPVEKKKKNPFKVVS